MTSTGQEYSVKHQPQQKSSVIDDNSYKKYDRVEAYVKRKSVKGRGKNIRIRVNSMGNDTVSVICYSNI